MDLTTRRSPSYKLLDRPAAKCDSRPHSAYMMNHEGWSLVASLSFIRRAWQGHCLHRYKTCREDGILLGLFFLARHLAIREEWRVVDSAGSFRQELVYFAFNEVDDLPFWCIGIEYELYLLLIIHDAHDRVAILLRGKVKRDA